MPTATCDVTSDVPAFLVDKRSAERFPYTAEHRVAAWHGDVASLEFLPAKCRDISSSGVCFYYPVKPETKFLAADFSSDSTQALILIEVAWSAPEMVDGQPCYRVGGKFDRFLVKHAKQ